MENFINGLDNDSCATILENLLFNVDSRDCARKLDNLLETYQFKHNIRQHLSESTINNARDSVLLREGDMDILTDTRDTQEGIKDIIKFLKLGMFTAIAAKFSLMTPTQKKMVLDQIRGYSTSAYAKLYSNPIVASVLPQDMNFFPRAMEHAWSFGKSNSLNAMDRAYLSKLGDFSKKTALVAGGIITGIIAINVAYKQFFTSEARKCKGLFGKKRTICMCNAIIAAAEEAQKKAEQALLQCDQSNNPKECRYKMKVEIRSWMKKIEEQKRKLARLQINKEAYPNGRPDKSKTSEVPVGTASDPFGDDVQNIPSNPFE